MAGGTFDEQVGKVRPGTYENFKTTKHDVLGISERGIVVVPLSNHTYGPVGEFVELTTEAPDGKPDVLGCSIYDNDANRQMLLIRNAFTRAAKVIIYKLNGGTIAQATFKGITAKAKYAGTTGNKLTFAILENPVDKYDVEVFLDGKRVAFIEGIDTVEAMNGQKYIDFSGSYTPGEGDDEDAALPVTAGVNLAGATDATASNADITAFLDKLEQVRFNTLCFPFNDASLQSAAKIKIKYIREKIGRGVQVVMPDTNAKDYEGVINVTNSYKMGDDVLSHAEACAWAAAAEAGASNTQSLTYDEVDGATEVVDPKTNEQAEQAIKNGEFFFSTGEGGEVIVEYDINTLTDFSGDKDKSYRKNRVIRVFDTFAEAIRVNFPPNKFDNSPTGWDIMEGIGRAILKSFLEAGAIKNVDYEADFLVDRSKSDGDETFFNVGLEAVDSAEKLYFTISTR